MRGRPAALLPLILTLWACAEGGSRGSGISTAVLGNVESVQTAGTGVEGIRVAVEGTSARSVTDTSGAFSVDGSFEGQVHLVFQLPDGGGEAQIALNVPAGGRLTLNNVAIDTDQAAATAETQDVDFDGTITGVYCQSLTLNLVSTRHGPDDVDSYTLRLDTSSVRNSQGDAVACGDIRDGQRAMVDGMVNPDGTFGDATVDLAD
jgi:hypothetical protein